MNEELQKKVDDAKTEGWALDEEGEHRAVMVKRGYGTLGAHVLIGLLTVWWTLGLGNIAYAAYKYFGDSDKKVIRAE